MDLTPPAPRNPSTDARPDLVVDKPQPMGDTPVAGDGPGDTTGDTTPEDGGVMEVPPLETGKRCSENSQCATGLCADGYCCSSECVGTCITCALPGSEGQCSPVPAGEDPRDQCPEEPVASCGASGGCDGNAACARHAAGTECAAGRCEAMTEYAASTCDGSGVCQPGSSRSCAPGMCMGSSCASSCTTEKDCQTGFFCEGSKCVVRRARGAACTMALQCASGHCIDGYCCDSACTGICNACNVATKIGICSPIPTGQDPQAECPAEAASTCGRAGACNGRGGCRLHDASVTCVAGSCAGFTEISRRACNGAGVCLPATTRDCAPYICGATACGTSCTMTSQCRAGAYCMAGACVPFGPGPVLYWKLDEPNGSTAADASGNGHSGTYFGSNGAPTTSALVPMVSFANPASRRFDADNRQAVRLQNVPNSLQPTTSYTLAFWVRTSRLDLGHDPPAASEALSQSDNYFVRLRATDVAFTRRAAGTYLSCFATGTDHLDGRWHHLAAVLSPAGMKVYLDGIERCTNTRNEPNLYDKGSDLFVGRHPTSPDWDFDGNIDDVRIYDRSLPADEIRAIATGF